MINRQVVIDRIFKAQDDQGFWKRLSPADRHYPVCMHYSPTYRASLWVLLQLAEVGADSADPRIRIPLEGVRDHLFDNDHGIFCLGKDHFPIPCLNGNMVYLDCYFNGDPGEHSRRVLSFFSQYQRFDDGKYEEPRNRFCSNTSCYGRHTCYWGIVKLLKGIAFIPPHLRSSEVTNLRDRCIDFILRHSVCYRSHQPGAFLTPKIDQLTFPGMYHGDFLEILWILKREHIESEAMSPAYRLLESKRLPDGTWPLDRKIHNLITPVGEAGHSNPFVTQRALEVLSLTT